MNLRYGKSILSKVAALSAALVGLGIVASPQANALITVTVKIGGVTADTFTDSGTNNASKFYSTLTLGGTTYNNLTVSATSNAPGDAIAQSGSLAQTSVTTSSTSGSGALSVEVSQSSPYNIPSGAALKMQSNISRSDGQTSNLLTFQSFASPTSGPADQTGGLQTQNPGLGNNVAPNQLTTALVGSTPYTIRNILTVAAQIGSLNVNGTTVVSALVPEPSSLAMAFMGVPMLALARRRRLKAPA